MRSYCLIDVWCAAISQGSAADNARRMHGAFLDMASGSSVPDDVSQHMMETAGASISEVSELLQ
jgi:hypothetical protein